MPFHRNSLNNIGNLSIFWVRLVMCVALGTMIGTMFLYTNNGITDNDIAVLLFGAHAFFVFISVAVVPFFIEEPPCSSESEPTARSTF